MTIREIDANTITDHVAGLCVKANTKLPDDLVVALEKAVQIEKSPLGRQALQIILENARIARQEGTPLCQDCGVAVVLVEIGQDVHITGRSLDDAISEGVSLGYRQGYLRKSMVSKPFSKRENTRDNTPPVIHTDIVSGNKIKIIFIPKGGGAENMSRVAMLKPGDGAEAIVKLVAETVKAAGGSSCPPLIIGLGIGGTLEKAALLAKKALVRPLENWNEDIEIAELEQKVLKKINRLGIGPLGMGGTVTALAVNAISYPCHMASLPVAVNLQCHSARYAEVVI